MSLSRYRLLCCNLTARTYFADVKFRNSMYVVSLTAFLDIETKKGVRCTVKNFPNENRWLNNRSLKTRFACRQQPVLIMMSDWRRRGQRVRRLLVLRAGRAMQAYCVTNKLRSSGRSGPGKRCPWRPRLSSGCRVGQYGFPDSTRGALGAEEGKAARAVRSRSVLQPPPHAGNNRCALTLRALTRDARLYAKMAATGAQKLKIYCSW